MRIETVPVIRFGHRIPGPVGGLKIFEDDASVFVLFGRVAPDVKIAPFAALRRAARPLKPGVLIGGVIYHHFRNHAQPAPVRLAQKNMEVPQCPVGFVDIRVVGDVVAVVPPRRGRKRKHPQRRHAEILKIIELLGQPAKIAHAVGAAVEKSTDVQFVDDRVFIPKRILAGLELWGSRHYSAYLLSITRVRRMLTRSVAGSSRHLPQQSAPDETGFVAQRKTFQYGLDDALSEARAFRIIDQHVNDYGPVCCGERQRLADPVRDSAVVRDADKLCAGGFGDSGQTDVSKHRTRFAIVRDLLALRNLTQFTIVENKPGNAEIQGAGCNGFEPRHEKRSIAHDADHLFIGIGELRADGGLEQRIPCS